ncbi:helix-turn-helix domain-containing protein [Priestia megaterium]|uniref:helix-turn-helix domain-containing protein n=1 Tax=Priestia megaterium TaxID=1404 RepID=UPI001375A1EE|nr:helix-turn-helix domain-containing protein [Priestia megaterium]
MGQKYYDVVTVSKLLEVDVETVRKWISMRELIAYEEGQNFYKIKKEDLEEFLKKNPSYNENFEKNDGLKNEINNVNYEKDSIMSQDNLKFLQEKIFLETLKDVDPDILFSAIIGILSSKLNNEWSERFNRITNKLSVVMQPDIDNILDMLESQIHIKVKKGLNVGNLLSRSEIANEFGRNAQEGINFSRDTKEIYLLTQIGADNPIVDSAYYNDYWKKGKIYYEGKGQQNQTLNGSNLHLYRRYQNFLQQVKSEDNVPTFIHVINKIGNKGKCYQYLGIFAVTDWFMDEHSENRTKVGETKRAFIFELTPVSDSKSSFIDENYEF